jgi:Xaa-Pro dipeptidase
MDLAALFSAHLARLQSVLEDALGRTGLDALVLSSGAPFTYFADDQDAAFHPVPHFNWWCPTPGPHHVLKLARGRPPLLVRYAPEDFWYEPAPLGEPYWVSGFDVREAATVDGVWAALGSVPRAAYVGNETDRAAAAGLPANPRELVARLDWARSYKTPYEVRCIEEATATAARGHEAARASFLDGGSELEVHHAFVQAAATVDEALAYPSIVALDEKSATLHYQGKRAVRNGRVLLIDAGTQSRGYACDITRTYAGSGCDPRFADLIEGVNALQQRVCAAVKPGPSFLDLHVAAHRGVAGLLVEQGLFKGTAEEAFEKGVTRAFLPHGLGHHLGLQVHDVAGRQKDPEGEAAPPPPEYPFLRNTRPIESGHVFTIEPGLYFIPLLLRAWREGPDAGRFDWKAIDALSAFGGIRIEDNVVVTETGHRNLTRERLPS